MTRGFDNPRMAGQLALLREEGCAEAQGYRLGRPAPMDRDRVVLAG